MQTATFCASASQWSVIAVDICYSRYVFRHWHKSRTVKGLFLNRVRCSRHRHEAVAIVCVKRDTAPSSTTFQNGLHLMALLTFKCCCRSRRVGATISCGTELFRVVFAFGTVPVGRLFAPGDISLDQFPTLGSLRILFVSVSFRFVGNRPKILLLQFRRIGNVTKSAIVVRNTMCVQLWPPPKQFRQNEQETNKTC